MRSLQKSRKVVEKYVVPKTAWGRCAVTRPRRPYEGRRGRVAAYMTVPPFAGGVPVRPESRALEEEHPRRSHHPKTCKTTPPAPGDIEGLDPYVLLQPA